MLQDFGTIVYFYLNTWYFHNCCTNSVRSSTSLVDLTIDTNKIEAWHEQKKENKCSCLNIVDFIVFQELY